jgi:hypothetical protein
MGDPGHRATVQAMPASTSRIKPERTVGHRRSGRRPTNTAMQRIAAQLRSAMWLTTFSTPCTYQASRSICLRA